MRAGSVTRGLAGWMERVLLECDRAATGLEPGTVHDLRVALRRCRTMADSLARVDDNAGWRAVKRSGKKLFHRLGELRDVQVLAERTLRLGGPGDPVRLALLARLLEREERLKKDARKALKRFPAVQWKTLARRLSARAAQFDDDGAVFEQLARYRLADAWALHRAATSRQTTGAWHRLRIGTKRFRYVVENFLPRRHEEWGEDLKRLQDLLGDVHDLDLLREELVAVEKHVPDKVIERWSARIRFEKDKRLDDYRNAASGRGSLWAKWRRELAPAKPETAGWPRGKGRAPRAGAPQPEARVRARRRDEGAASAARPGSPRPRVRRRRTGRATRPTAVSRSSRR